MYKCISGSISDDIKTTVFSQVENVPTHEDGISLFKLLTTFTSIATVQVSIMSLQNILDFDPSEHKFKILDINTQLTNLFVLATTGSTILDPNERIFHTLAVYGKILQPESWGKIQNR